IKSWLGQPYHAHHFARTIRQLHQDDPDIRFALVGFGLGASWARDLAASLAGDPVPIDLLVAIGEKPAEAAVPLPSNGRRSGSVAAAGDEAAPDEVKIELPRPGRLGAATHPATLALLASELAAVARRVPLVEHPLPPPPSPAPADAPA